MHRPTRTKSRVSAVQGTLPLLLTLSAMACRGSPGPGLDSGSPLTTDPWRWAEVAELGGQPTALTALGSGFLVALGGSLWESPDGLSWLDADTTGLPAGDITLLGAMDPDAPVALAFVHGHGLFRDDGGGWSAVEAPPSSALLTGLNPRSEPVAMDFAADPGTPDTAWLATVGVLYRTDDAGRSWAEVTGLADAGFNILFTGVDVRGDDVAATAFRPAGVLPEQYADLLTTAIFRSTDGGTSWFDGDPAASTRYPTDVVFDPNGNAWVSTQDAGLLQEAGDGWVAVGGPADGLGLAWSRGGVNLATGRQGVWRYQAAGWTHAGSGPIAVVAQDHALSADGRHWVLEPGGGEPSGGQGDATVFVALSMHVNLYHSYRGDSNDDDGYGLDLDVMRNTLRWLGERAELHADWDMDNAWSSEERLQTDGADVLAEIQSRVAAGTDDVRLMSWNNGAMPAHTRTEFDESIQRAWQSNQTLFEEVVPGVQPQECMFTPEHVEWYADDGVAWITLFNSATPFTALPNELDLPVSVWNNPVDIATDTASLVLVPVYHHGDLLNHGGLRGWATALHEASADDQLLVIHFDADAESWERFDREIDDLADLDFIRFTTIQDYLDQHGPAVRITAPMDVADGTGDGLQSWAEKDFNHEIATGIARARELAERASALGGDDEGIAAMVDDALEPRLRALSTTHFGLAAPTLHPDRVDQAREYVARAIERSTQAFDAAAALHPVAPGTIELRETHGASGTALIEATVEIPRAAWTAVDDIRVFDSQGAALPVAVTALREEDPVQVDLAMAVPVEARATAILTWTLDPAASPAPEGVDSSLLNADPGLLSPFTECDGVGASAEDLGRDPAVVDPLGVMASQDERWRLWACGEAGSLRWTRRVISGLPGVIVDVDAELPELSPDSLDLFESIALSPLRCDGAADSVQWRTMGGSRAERPVRQGVPTWNGQVIDGWARVQCADGTGHAIAHRVTDRTSLGFLPIRTDGEDALLAPLGTLWGPAPLHHARHTGGHGMGDVVTEIIGSQFRPAAPDWSGKAVRYRLLLSARGVEEPDEGTLDLFAHPPLVRVGAWTD